MTFDTISESNEWYAALLAVASSSFVDAYPTTENVNNTEDITAHLFLEYLEMFERVNAL